MLWAATVANWLFGMCFAGSIGAMWFSLEWMRKRVNLALPSGQRLNWHPPRAGSLGQLVSKSHILAHYLQLVGQHRELYPSSSLPKALSIAIAGSVVGFLGTIASCVIN